MANVGMGVSPLGIGIFGFGVPGISTPDQGNLLEIRPDGVSQDARYIDPITRDYTIDINGRVVGQPSVAQQVFLAIMTTQGSSAIPSLGNQLLNIKTMDASTIQAKAQNYINVALSTLIKTGAIKLISAQASINVNNVCVNLTIIWQNNTTGTINTTVAVLNG